jgi:hypothetical protein
MLMQKEFPEYYDFFPITYILPYELAEFRNQFLKLEDPYSPKKKIQSKKDSIIITESAPKIKE